MTPLKALPVEGTSGVAVEAAYRYWMLDEDEPDVLDHGVERIPTAGEA